MPGTKSGLVLIQRKLAEEAQAKARAYGWDTKVYTEKEFYDTFGNRLRP